MRADAQVRTKDTTKTKDLEPEITQVSASEELQ